MCACVEVKACAVERAINGAIVVVDIAVVELRICMGADVANRVYGTTDIKQADLFAIDDDLFGCPDG
jgi:hypothetical protein